MFLILDIGATNTKLSLSRDLNKSLSFQIFKTNQNFDLWFSEVVSRVNDFGPLKGIVLALPGVLSDKRDRLINCHNLPKWTNKKIKNRFDKEFKCQTYIFNDANLAALGEATFGSGKGFKSVYHIMIGTGLGGARIIDSKIDYFNSGFEPGHQIVKIGDNGDMVSLESLVSGKNFFKIYKIKAEDCNNEEIWSEVSRYLSIGLINISTIISPDIITIGGGLSKKTILLKLLKKHFNKDLKVIKPPKILKGKLGDEAAIFGGFHFLKNLNNKHG
ncbi:MAG: ROK family protein [Patescibacteria group bacterium]